MDRGIWQTTVHGVAKSQTQLNTGMPLWGICTHIPIAHYPSV